MRQTRPLASTVGTRSNEQRGERQGEFFDCTRSRPRGWQISDPLIGFVHLLIQLPPASVGGETFWALGTVVKRLSTITRRSRGVERR
jgi:hypothetical protein